MTTDSDKTQQLKRALQAIKDLRARLESVEQSRHEPVAVIGMACRFPGGADSPQALWDALKNQVDGITPVPADRWSSDVLFDADPDVPGKVATRWGGFLPEIDSMDAPFFGISPREASRMDPQQRLMLEVTWEAFEDAGLTVEKLAGSSTGVFVGLHSHSSDYYLMQAFDPEEMDIYSGTGTSHSVVSGRISYLYDLQGPSIALDTACSSSLVAVHLAVQSIRNGECNMALAGGVNVMLTPHFTVVASRMRMMAADGRCKAFDSRADGFVRSEGCGVVVLKRLSDALRDGDNVLALIRGSAINQDGHSNGLTAPNGLSQQAVIRQALQNAGVQPSQVSYVETHGTGTPLGDPIEVEALAAVYGQPRADGVACVLGSVKSNLGHLEGAAGVAGLIKTVLSLQHRTIPANLHFQHLNPHISLDGTRLRIADAEKGWNSGDDPRYAAVSAFGWSGTNAHVVLQEAPVPATDPATQLNPETQAVPYLLPISARSNEALQAMVEIFHKKISANGLNLADLCFSAAQRRSHHPYRVAVVGHSRPEMAAALEAYLHGESHAQLAAGQVAENHQPAVVFVFPGQGGQWLGMGRQLFAQDAAFRRTIEQCEQAFQPYVDWSLREQLAAQAGAVCIEEIDVVQPVLFAIQVALAASLRARGVTPDAVIGHSMGEVSAAYVAGALSLEDAARVICTRSRLMRRVSGKGAMAVIGLSLEKTNELLSTYPNRLSAAVSNSPSSTVISGDPRALEEVLASLRSQNIFCRAVNVDVAAHSPQMEALRPELVAALAGIRPQATSAPLFSTVEGKQVDGTTLDAAYWGRNLRQPVLFSSAIQRLTEEGYSAFVECGPHPVLLSAIGQHAQAENPRVLLPAMRREEDEQLVLQAVLAGLYCAGATLDWTLAQPAPGKSVALPLYPWQRKRYWVQTQAMSDPLAGWFYQVDWKPQPRVTPSSSVVGRWLVLCEPGAPDSTGQALAGRLEALGGKVTRVWAGEAFAKNSAGDYTLNPQRPEQFEQLIAAVCGQPAALNGVAYCWALAAPETTAIDLSGLERAQSVHTAGALHLAQALAAAAWQPQNSPLVWFITRGAQPAGGSRPTGLAQAPLWGFGRVLAFEQPELWGGLIDVDEQSLEAVVDELLGPADQQTAFRAGQRYQAQLARQNSAPVATQSLEFQAEASYLVTGGLGGLGLKVAAWLAANGAKHIALMGRSRGSETARQVAQALEATGVQVLLVQGDTGQPEDVRRVFAEIAAAMPPLRGIIHSAGTVEDAVLARQTWAGYTRVFASKVSGAWNLHQLSQDLELDHFILFSSAASVLGTPGQSNYAAANAFLDALAYERRAAGLPVRVINWGAWGEVGLAAQLERPASLSHLGIDSFSPETGLQALHRALRQSEPQVMVAAMNWGKYVDQRPGGFSCAFFASVRPAQTSPVADGSAADERPALIQQLEGVEPKDRAAVLSAHVHEIVAKVLRYDTPESLNPDQGFFQLGLDSLMAVELKNRLQKSMGRSLRTTLAFDYPSIHLLSRYLLAELYPQQPEGQATQAPVEQAAQETGDEALADLSREEVKSLLDDELRILEEDL